MEKISIVTRYQKKVFTKYIQYGGKDCIMYVTIRYDDECKNGHNSFSITGDIWKCPKERQRDIVAGGCIHEEIEKYFPELAKYIPYHLFDSDGPMHYLPNTLYLAGNRDCHGLLKGEVSNYDDVLYFGNFPIAQKFDKSFIRWYLKNVTDPEDEQIIPIAHENRPGDNYQFAPKYDFVRHADKWHNCPFDTMGEALEFVKAAKLFPPRLERFPTAFSEGKERQFDAARSAACWPEATDAELSLSKEELKAKLLERLPGLLTAFQEALKELDFVY